MDNGIGRVLKKTGGVMEELEGLKLILDLLSLSSLLFQGTKANSAIDVNDHCRFLARCSLGSVKAEYSAF